MAELVAELKEITTKVIAILDRVIELYADSGQKVDEYSKDGFDWRVYHCPARKALVGLAELSTKGTFGDKHLSIRVDSYLGRNKFEYLDTDGYKFAFAYVQGKDVKIKFKRASSSEIVLMDTAGDLDLDF